MNQQTNYDEYLEKQLQDSDFAKRFKRAGQAWDVAFQLASLRKDAGLSQKKLARKVGTTQQQIRRLEPQQRAHSPWLAAGLASESKIRQNSLRGKIPRGLPRGASNNPVKLFLVSIYPIRNAFHLVLLNVG